MTRTIRHRPTVRRGTGSSLPLVLAGLLGGAATASGIALTATSGWLIVRAGERPVLLTLLTAIVAVRAFGMARPAFRYVERLRSHDVALGDLADRRQQMYAALVPLTPARLGRRARADVLTGVVDDLDDVVESQVRVTVPVLSSLVAGVVATALAAALLPPVGLVLAGLLALVALGCVMAHRLESAGRDAVLAARAEVMRVSDLVARQADELRAVGGERAASGWLDGAHATLRRLVARQSRGRALVAAMILSSTAAATLVAASLTWGSGVSGPVAALLVVVPIAVGDALAPLADAMRALAQAEGARIRLAGLLTQTPAVVDPRPPASAEAATSGTPRADRDAAAPALRLRGVGASWTGTTQDLAPIDLDIEPGRHIAIIGANGSGKSTLLAVLARHLDPAGGSYTIDGVDVREMGLADARSYFAIVDDEPHVFSSTLRANLAFAAPDPGDVEDAALVAALDRAGLGELFTGLPDGLDTRLGEGGRGLSGGERARLGLARAVVSRRPVLLLDEPLAHLDHATANGIMQDLSGVGQGSTLVMVSHRPEGLEFFDLVLDLTPRETACLPNLAPATS